MLEFWTNSFLGTRGSFMLDFVSLAMVGILVMLAVSIVQVKLWRRYTWHKRCQLAIGSVLAVAVILFEVDIRFVTDWQARAEPSPYFDRNTWSMAWCCLAVHLCCAVPTACLWLFAIVQALRHFPSPPGPGDYSGRHAWWGWLATVGTVLTALTGWLFYWLAFVAT